MMASYDDPASQSNPTQAAATHASMVLAVDFETRVIRGFVEYNVEIKVDGTRTFALDTSKLVPERVEVDGKRARWVQHRRHGVFGAALEIFLPAPQGNGDGQGYPRGHVLKVKVHFCTSPRSTAIQWLPPEQTHGGVHPYLFTQGQAIHSRSLLPCQDCPSVKITYDAKVTVPKWATCLMSALEAAPPVEIDGDLRVFSWTQPVPIPSYLIAIAVGDLDSREISPRCRIWSEPGVVDKAAFDFSQTEEFLQAAESLVGPYEWGRYDVLCLPPSFPYGGMENPCLTFVTPTLLSGDKSLAFVIAHEISHSWTGNLVTNRTWEHFWLNEGWTMWLERKIMTKIAIVEFCLLVRTCGQGRLHPPWAKEIEALFYSNGAVTGDPNYYDFGAMLGYGSLEDSVELFKANNALELTRLVPDLKGVDPDDAFSSVPYEKGFALLNELQRRVGVEPFEAFAKEYIAHFRRGTVDSHEFKQFFLGKFPDKAAALQSLNWDAWFKEPGMPSETPTFNETLCVESQTLADQWLMAATPASTGEAGEAGGVGGLEEKVSPPADPESARFAGWPSPQKVMFLQLLLERSKARKTPFPLPLLQAMDEAYGLTKTGNSEIRFCWHMLCLGAKAFFIVPHVLDFVTSMGRMKFARPLYRELFAHGETRSIAVETFKDRAFFYHPICRAMVAKDLGVHLDEAPRPMGKSGSGASLSMSRTSSEVEVGQRDGVGTARKGSTRNGVDDLSKAGGAGTDMRAPKFPEKSRGRVYLGVSIGLTLALAVGAAIMIRRRGPR